MTKEYYDHEYHKYYIKGVYIPFNKITPRDCEIMEWLAAQKNKTAYIKNLIEQDMKQKREKV